MVPIRGGNWNNGANAGVFYLNLNNARSNSNTNIGARPDSDSPRSQQWHGGTKGGVFLRAARPAKSAFRRLSGRPATSRLERQATIS